jgi:hypothetical protein
MPLLTSDIQSIDACRPVRKMRGCSQAHLIEATNGRFYVVKFTNNPLRHRILINEWIASATLKHLAIATPETAAVYVSERFLIEHPEVYVEHRAGREPIEPGFHFGSQFPNDPAATTVYDFIPDPFLSAVKNLAEFLGVLAFDKWTGNTDSRQAVFFRTAPITPMVAQMIDNGHVFHGPDWRLDVSPVQGLYFHRSVYREVRTLGDFEPWLTRIIEFPESVLVQVIKDLPRAWLAGDESALEALVLRLLRRRKSVPDLIAECHADELNPFPNWQ